MELITILNHCHHHRGFVYQQDRFTPDKKMIQVTVRPRKGSMAVCSGCHNPAPGYDRLPERRFEFIPFWGFLIFFLYAMRRVDCRRCHAVVVEEVPWGDGKRHLTNAYMLFLARWARRLSWKETAEAFHTSWDKVFDAVDHAVTWGLGHRTLGQIDAIGVDEIQYAKGHKYLTLVYQIDLGITRLLWVGKERTVESFRGFFTIIGDDLASKIVFVCSDMWEPYLKVNGEESKMRRKTLGNNNDGHRATICSSLITRATLVCQSPWYDRWGTRPQNGNRRAASVEGPVKAPEGMDRSVRRQTTTARKRGPAGSARIRSE